MTAKPKLNSPRKKGLETFWKACFFVTLALILFLIYSATQKVDYVWRWNRVPQYFFYHDDIEIRSELDGTVASVSYKGEEAIVVVRGDDGESEQLDVPKDGLRVDEGDTIFMGDTVGSYKEWKPGIMLQGLWITLKVSIVSIFFGIFLGLMTGLMRISDNPMFRWSAITYIEIIRGSPLLVQIFIWYFVVGTLINTILANQGIPQIPPLWFGVASLAIFTGAYVAEIVRAGIQSIRRGQTEAARSLGMTKAQSMRHIILPQAFKRILPPLAGQFISLIKDSSLLGIIAIRELTKATREVVSTSLQPFEMWFLCAILYLVLTFTLSMFVQYLEKRTIQK